MPNALSVVQKFFPDVETVKDATRDVRIDVTVADTKARGMKNHKACAMAVACKRKLHLDGAVVSRSIAYLVKDNVATRYRVPESAAREVVAYDRGGSFAPGEYKLQKHAKVTVGQALAIRERARAGESYVSLARDYGLSDVSVRNIVKRVTWKWLDTFGEPDTA